MNEQLREKLIFGDIDDLGSNKLEKALYDRLQTAVLAKYMNASVVGPTDLLVDGLTGSGKTAITRAWIEECGLNGVWKGAGDYFRYEKMLDGGEIEDGFFEREFGALDAPDSVLVLDDFGYASERVRDLIYSVSDERALPEGSTGEKKKLNGWLFTVAIRTVM